jgi:LPXTG-site transpeptidase (sortase) family protein
MGSSSRRLQLIFLGAIGVMAIAGVFMLNSGSSADGVSLTPGGDIEFSDEAPLITGSRRVDAPIEGEPEERPMDNVADFVREHGEPPNSDYGRIRIPSIGVDAPVGLFIVDESAMPDPQGPVDVAFYDMRNWEGMGGYPGEGRNAIFGAHVDLNRSISYAGGAHYRGPAVFWSLDRLVPGDVIEVDAGGQTLRYAVVWSEEVDTVNADWGSIWSSDVATDSITLFTCGGEFDFNTLEYSHRVVVRAERI